VCQVVRVEPVDSASSSDVKVAEKTKVGFSSGALSVKTTKSGAKDGSVAITIELPVGSKLVLNTAWTDVHTDGLFGDCELNIASGHVQLDRVAALCGNLAAGEVTVGHVAGPVDLEGGTAGIRIGEAAGVVPEVLLSARLSPVDRESRSRHRLRCAGRGARRRDRDRGRRGSPGVPDCERTGVGADGGTGEYRGRGRGRGQRDHDGGGEAYGITGPAADRWGEVPALLHTSIGLRNDINRVILAAFTTL
jgi:hypothetical protein